MTAAMFRLGADPAGHHAGHLFSAPAPPSPPEQFFSSLLPLLDAPARLIKIQLKLIPDDFSSPFLHRPISLGNIPNIEERKFRIARADISGLSPVILSAGPSSTTCREILKFTICICLIIWSEIRLLSCGRGDLAGSPP